MRFTDKQLKIGINLYESGTETYSISETYVDADGTTKSRTRQLNRPSLSIIGNKTLIFDSFIKKSSLSVKPEFQNLSANLNVAKKEQVAIEKFYDIQFEVLSQDRAQAIENYNKLLQMINHFYYMKVRTGGTGTELKPNRYGNAGIIFRGNPPIFSINTKGFVDNSIDKNIPNGYGKEYECVIITENFSYDIDYDKGYILVKSTELSKDHASKVILDQYETLVPISFTISMNGTIPYDRYDTNNENVSGTPPLAPPLNTGTTETTPSPANSNPQPSQTSLTAPQTNPPATTATGAVASVEELISIAEENAGVSILPAARSEIRSSMQQSIESGEASAVTIQKTLPQFQASGNPVGSNSNVAGSVIFDQMQTANPLASQLIANPGNRRSISYATDVENSLKVNSIPYERTKDSNLVFYVDNNTYDSIKSQIPGGEFLD